MFCLLYYRFSASPVLLTFVATKASELRKYFLLVILNNPQ